MDGTSWSSAIIGFIVALVPLIILHEFGHLLMAKHFGVWAREFGIGYPPRIMKLFRWGETVFTLNWLPVGGFVRLEGEMGLEGPESPEPQGKTPEELAEDAEARRHRLDDQPTTAKMWIFLAGPLMNLLTAWVLAVIMFMSGVPTAEVGGVMPNSPAQAAGMQVGDAITAINGTKVESAGDVSRLINSTTEQSCEIALLRGGETVTVTVTPRVEPQEGQKEGRKIIGITLALKHYPLLQAMTKSTNYCWTFTKLTLTLPFQVARGDISPSEARPVGMYGIIQLAGSALDSSVAANALYPILSLIILVSLSLGIFNLLPIPPLDGGHLLFLVVELVRGKPLTPELKARIFTIAMGLMLLLFFYITALDIINPIPIP